MSDKNTTQPQDPKALADALKKAEERAANAEAALAKAQKPSGSEAKLRDQVKDLTAQLKAREDTLPKNANPLVTHDGEIFEVIGGERRNGKLCTKQELAKDTERCKALRDLGSGLLRKAVKKTAKKATK